MDAFKTVYDFTCEVEGYKSNHRLDPGGYTVKGVALNYLDEDFDGDGDIDRADLDAMTAAQHEAHFKRRFWDHMKGDLLPPALAMACFDAAVNPGPGAAPLILQRALGVRVDGIIGPITLRTARSAPLEETLIDFHARRLLYYGTRPRDRYEAFGRGWNTRVLRLHAICLAAI